MTPSVELHENPEHVLDVAGTFLASRPVLHNLMLTLLHARATVAEPGRYWVVADPDADGDGVVGVAFQSPLDLPATVTPMPAHAVAALVAEIAGEVRLPGVNGEAVTAARFAGQWTEHAHAGARPVDGQRIYQVDEPVRPTAVAGTPRRAEPADRDLLIEWLAAFDQEAGGFGGGDPEGIVDRRLPAGHFWIWHDDRPVSLAAHTDVVEGVARIQAVYTPPDLRGHGYAAASVAALSARLLEAGHGCILFTDLANPTSNSVYRRIGYRAVAECLRYEFL
jgi:uncharacterized protein